VSLVYGIHVCLWLNFQCVIIHDKCGLKISYKNNYQDLEISNIQQVIVNQASKRGSSPMRS